jgi:hypothetical protein
LLTFVVKQHPDAMSIAPPQPKAKSSGAFSLMELLIAMALAVLLALVVLPGLAKSRARSSRANCWNNMSRIGLGFLTWSLDNNDSYPMQVSVTNGGTMELVTSGVVYPHFEVMSNELSTPKILLCPSDEKRTFATQFGAGLGDTNVSYFVNTDAAYRDGSSLLCGDRNITNRAPTSSRLVPLTVGNTIAWTREMRVQKGYVGFGDGRVGSFSNGGVGAAIRTGAGTTNWLAVP